MKTVPATANDNQRQCPCDDCVQESPTLWWMSFCDPSRPTGLQFLGAVVLDVPANKGAIEHSHALGLNPGGEVVLVEVQPDKRQHFPTESRNRLLSKEEASSL